MRSPRSRAGAPGRACRACGLQAFLQKLLAARKQFFFRNLASIDVGQNRALCLIFFIFNASFALQHTPRFASLDAEQHELPRNGAVLGIAVRSLNFDVHAEVWYVGAMIGD